jgi:hypothetical protein
VYTLTDATTLAVHGSGFSTLAKARDYAFNLREFGLCKAFNIGRYKEGKYIIVYQTSIEEGDDMEQGALI